MGNGFGSLSNLNQHKGIADIWFRAINEPWLPNNGFHALQR